MNRKEEQKLVSEMTKYERKQYFKAKKEIEDKRKSKIRKFMVCLGSVFLIFLIGVSIYNSLKPVYIIGNEKLDEEEYNFYYTMFTNNYINENYQYLSYFGLDFQKDLSEQVYDSETGETWQDFFDKRADMQIQEILSVKIEADKNQYVCEDLDNQVSEFVNDMKEASVESGTDFNTYIKSIFGNKMNESKLKKIVSKYLYAMDYSSTIYDSFEITDSEIIQVYNESKEDYDKVDYLCYTILPNLEPTATEEEQTLAKEVAKESAVTLYSKISNGEDFVEVINSVANETDDLLSDISFSNIRKKNISSVLAEWLYDNSRKEGDVELIENENTGEIYLVKFVNRYIDESNTVDARHILVAFEYDENNNLVEGTEEVAKSKIEEIKTLYEANPTVENFEKLVKEYSDDTAVSGGLYKGISKGEMVEEFDSWIFDKSRSSEDIEIVKTDFGYHLIYFQDYNDPSYIVEIRNELKEDKYEKWSEAILVNYTKN